MLNCSTCHKKKPTEHFYAYPEHRAHIPLHASPEDSEALARLLADGLLDSETASQTPTRARATLASAREQLATSGRPEEDETQRARREAAQARAEAAYDAAYTEDEDADGASEGEGESGGWWTLAGIGSLIGLFIGGAIYVARHSSLPA